MWKLERSRLVTNSDEPTKRAHLQNADALDEKCVFASSDYAALCPTFLEANEMSGSS